MITLGKDTPSYKSWWKGGHLQCKDYSHFFSKKISMYSYLPYFKIEIFMSHLSFEQQLLGQDQYML